MRALPPWARLACARDLPPSWRPGVEPGSIALRFGAEPQELERPGATSGVWLLLRSPLHEFSARTPAEVHTLLARADGEVGRGRVVAGFFAYEAAPAFDPAFTVRSAPPAHPDVPPPLLAWLGVYDSALAMEALPPLRSGPCRLGRWRGALDEFAYDRDVESIRGWIARGHVYQVNYTHLRRASFRGDPWALFRALERAQPSAHAAFVHAGERIVCSASPELLLRMEDGRAETRPMKGTRRRGPTLDEDDRLAWELLRSAKDRAENVMITDMARNDLGRVSAPGSVQVTALCALERYPTVWQLTSTVRGSATAPVPACLGALFPAASITGAPKVRAMELIAELEREPRGVYTGSVGLWGPGPRVEFSVAIRTVSIDPRAGEAVYGTGGGIVWDSHPEAERAEAGWKSRVLVSRMRPFQLLETVLWDAGGYRLLERHLARLCDSAAYFAFPVEEEEVRRRLRRAERVWRRADLQARLVRLRLDAAGVIRIASAPAPPAATRPWRVALCARPIDPGDPFLHHKTTRRAVYRSALRGRPGCDDVLLWNSRGEVTESTIANLAVMLDGEWVTPAASSGLLPGTMRAELLERGEIREAIVRIEDLARAGEIRLFNSVRGWISAALVPDVVAGDVRTTTGEAPGRRDPPRVPSTPGPAPAPRSDSRSAIVGP